MCLLLPLKVEMQLKEWENHSWYLATLLLKVRVDFFLNMKDYPTDHAVHLSIFFDG